jgi:predicted kinase
VPFTCDVCGRSTFPELIPPVGDLLRCPHCGDERRFARPSLLVVTGTVGIGKSTLCARLAGTIPGTVLLDADIFAEDLVSVAPPHVDYEAFWRSMLSLAHELAQNNVVVVYFSVMRPEQLLANSDLVGYFHSVNFLCLTCPADVLRARLARREPAADPAGFERWVDFNGALAAAASDLPTADVADASHAIDQVEHEVRDWIKAQLQRRGALTTDPAI